MPTSHRNHRKPKNNRTAPRTKSLPTKKKVERNTERSTTPRSGYGTIQKKVDAIYHPTTIAMPGTKRFNIVIQHEVIMYGENQKAVEHSLMNHPDMKLRTNLRCVYITEIPMPIDERQTPIIDERKAPGL